MDCLCADLDYSNEPAFCPVHPGIHVGVERLRAKCRKRDAEIARLKAGLSEARRHAVGVMAAGFNRALDEAGAPPAESPGLRIYAMRDEIARLRRALAAGPAALRAMMAQDNHGDTFDACAEVVERAQAAAMKEGT